MSFSHLPTQLIQNKYIRRFRTAPIVQPFHVALHTSNLVITMTKTEFGSQVRSMSYRNIVKNWKVRRRCDWFPSIQVSIIESLCCKVAPINHI